MPHPNLVVVREFLNPPFPAGMSIHTTLNNLERGITAISLTAAWVLIPTLIIVRTFDIVARQYINTPNMFIQFVEWRAFLFLVLLGFGHAYLKNSHVRIDLFKQSMSQRAQMWIEVAGFFLAILPFCWVLIQFGGEFAVQSFDQGEREVIAFGRPVQWMVKGMLSVSGVLLLLAGMVVLMRNLIILFTTSGGKARSLDPEAPTDPGAPTSAVSARE